MGANVGSVELSRRGIGLDGGDAGSQLGARYALRDDPAGQGLGVGTGVSRSFGRIAVTTPHAACHHVERAGAARGRVSIPERRQAEVQAEDVGEGTDGHQARVVAVESRDQGVVLDHDRATARCSVVGGIGAAEPVRVAPEVGPQLAAATLAAAACLHHHQQVHDSVVVTGIGQPVGTVVVVLGEIDCRIVERDHLVDESTGRLGGARAQPVAARGAKVERLVLRGGDPGFDRAIDQVVAVGNLVEIVSQRTGPTEAAVARQEEFVGQLRGRPGVCARVEELSG